MWVAGRSAPQTLLEQVALHEASLLVVGSSSDAEPGRVALSSKTDRLAHSSSVPVAIAPHGYTASGPFKRVTVGFRGDDATWSMLNRVSELASGTGVSVRVVTFMVAPGRRPVTTSVSHAETQVIELWTAEAQEAQTEAKTHLEGDVLVLGSSSTHPLAQVFVGSSAAKIIRHATVPVVVVPGAGS